MLSEEWKASESDEPAVEMILQDMKAEIFAATLRKLEDSVDNEFFERFFQEMMAKMHKTAPKLKTLSMKFIASIENIEILHKKFHSVHCKFTEILPFLYKKFQMLSSKNFRCQVSYIRLTPEILESIKYTDFNRKRKG